MQQRQRHGEIKSGLQADRGRLEQGLKQLSKLRPIARAIGADSQSHSSSGGGGRVRYPEDDEKDKTDTIER